MDGADCWYDQASSSITKISTSSTIDQHLVICVRSLCLSPDKDPSPLTLLIPITSDHNFKENATSLAKSSDLSSRPLVNSSIAKLAQAKPSKQVMAVTKYDGPAGQLKESPPSGFRRHPSELVFNMNDSLDATKADRPSGAGTNHRALGNLVGAEHGLPVNSIPKAMSREILRTPWSVPRKPRYTVRTVAPLKSKAIEEPRPVTRHVPGSFRSETSVVTVETSDGTNPTLPSKGTEVHGDDSDLVLPLVAHESGDTASAVEERKKPFDVANEALPPSLPSSHSDPALNKDGKNAKTAVVELREPPRPVRNPFFKPYSSHLASEPSRQPVATSEDQNDISEPYEAYSDARLDIGKEPKIASLQPSSTPDSIPRHSSSATYSKDEPRLISLTTPDSSGRVNRDEAAEGKVLPERKSTATYTPSVYSRNTSLGHQLQEHPDKSNNHLMEVGINPSETELKNKSSTIPKKTEQLDVSEPAVKQTPLEVTQRSGLKSLADLNYSNGVPSTTWTKHEMMEFVNEANRLRRSLSVSSINTGSTGDNSDMARLIQKTSAGRSSHCVPLTALSASGVESPSSRHQWVQYLLGRQLSPSPREAHLTQRPSTIENGVLGREHHSMPSYHHLDAHDSSHKFLGGEFSHATTTARLQQQVDPETISKVILDLESLMREVLLIAKHVAAGKEVENVGPALIVKGPTDVNNSTGYSRDTAYKRLTLPIDRAVSSKGVWATSDGNASFGTDSVQEQSSVSGDRINFVESAMASQERSSSQAYQDRTLHPTLLNLHISHPSASPDLGQEFRSVSTHARELARHLKLPDPSLRSPSKTVQQRDERRESILVGKSLATKGDLRSPSVIDFASKARRGSAYPETIELPVIPQKPLPSQQNTKAQRSFLLRGHPSSVDDSLQNAISQGNAPQVQTRTSSVQLQRPSLPQDGDVFHNIELSRATSSDDSVLSFSGESTFRRHMTSDGSHIYQQPGGVGPGNLPAQDTLTTLRGPPQSNFHDNSSSNQGGTQPRPNLKNMHHFSIRGPPGGFSLRFSHHRAPIARDWSDTRKRFVATVTCLNTALLGIIIGIYAGEVPAIQYAIADENHYTILGNVVFYLGLAVPTFFFWPLPLLHGRKPYTLAALAILMPLQFPQAVVVGSFRSPDSPMYRIGLLLPRSFAGVAMGFANINFQTTLLDLFGASLQSGNPHQEVVDENDVRRHGGGMGVWLGLWTWCSIGSLGVGFLIGAVIISGLNVAWGFWITIILTAVVLILNVVTPEVRRSPYRRSLAEVPQGDGDVSRRIARGEIMMHLYQTGPKHWWEEVRAGLVLVKRMLSQPAFVVMAVYLGWIYGQIVMVIVLLGALTSRYYRFHPQYVGLCVGALPIGALLALPFQRANVFSRARHHPPRTDSMTFQKRFTWTSHLVRRITFMLVLPFAGLAYTLSSGGPPTPFILPTIFAGAIGFLSNLAIAECYGIIMETFDTSDLQPGMTGRPRKVLSEDVKRKQTNFSCFPRVTAAFMICQTFSFIIAAAATGTGGRIERQLGAQASTGVVAGVLLILTAALTVILIRIKTVQVVPVKRWGTAQLSGPGDDWKPVIVGHPSGINRRVSLLEQGALTRWVEIRRRNRLLDEQDRRVETFGIDGRDTGFRPGPGPGPSGVRDFVRRGDPGMEGRK